MFEATNNQNLPFSDLPYKVFGNALSPYKELCMFYPLNTINGSSTTPAALQTPNTVMFYWPAPNLIFNARSPVLL